MKMAARRYNIGYTGPVYYMIRFGYENLLRCRNTINRHSSVLQNYGGNVLGIGEVIDVLENGRGNYMWRENHCIVIYHFNHADEGQRWMDSAPEVNQSDWIDGADIVCFPAQETAIPPAGNGYILLTDMAPFEDVRYEVEYAGHVSNKLRELGGIPGLAYTPDVKHIRGLWNPGTITMHYFPNRETLDQIYSSEDYKNAKQVRTSTSQSDVVCFQLTPVKLPDPRFLNVEERHSQQIQDTTCTTTLDSSGPYDDQQFKQ